MLRSSGRAGGLSSFFEDLTDYCKWQAEVLSDLTRSHPGQQCGTNSLALSLLQNGCALA